jgi:hypothetical protein
MTNQKAKVWVYFSTYGSHKHDVLVIQEGGEPYDTMRCYHKMLDPHQPDFGRTFSQVMARYLNEQHEVVFLETPNNN